MGSHNELGKKGEEIAANYLIKNGYVILDLNWRFQKSEIDIIAKKENTLFIIEVKTRSSIHIISPENAVNQKKIKLLVVAANEYVSQKKLNIEVQFDIITIHKKHKKHTLNHIKDAFLPF